MRIRHFIWPKWLGGGLCAMAVVAWLFFAILWVGSYRLNWVFRWNVLTDPAAALAADGNSPPSVSYAAGWREGEIYLSRLRYDFDFQFQMDLYKILDGEKPNALTRPLGRPGYVYQVSEPEDSFPIEGEPGMTQNSFAGVPWLSPTPRRLGNTIAIVPGWLLPVIFGIWPAWRLVKRLRALRKEEREWIRNDAAKVLERAALAENRSLTTQ